MNLEEIICGKAVPGLPVACQGVECSYSSIACRQVFCNPEITFYETFEEVFQSVIEGKNTYGVVPIENTLAGSVTDNYDLMLEYNLFIAASVTVKIDHCLLALPGTRLEEIRHIYSHPQALHQCSDFFRSHREITPHTYSNTAASAQFVAQQQNPSFGAIGSIRFKNFNPGFAEPEKQLHPLCCGKQGWGRLSPLQPHQPDTAPGSPPRRLGANPFPLCRKKHQPAEAGIPPHSRQPL